MSLPPIGMEDRSERSWWSCCYWGSLARQVCCVLVVASTMLQTGLLLGWPATLPSLQDDNTTEFNVTDTDVKWLISCVGLTGMVSNLPIGAIIDQVGYRHLMTYTFLPVAATWVMQALAPSLTVVYIGRILGGVGFMCYTTLANPLMTELLEPKYRGLLGCLTEIMVSVGILLAYLMAEFLSWRVVTLLCAVPFVPLFFLSLNVPESPYWLVRAGRYDEAEEALITLRGPLRRQSAQEELLQIQKSIKEQPQTKLSEQIRQIPKPQNYRPLLLLIGLITLRELGGQFAIFSYAVYFFLSAGLEIDASTCTVLLGLVRLISTIICAGFLDRAGRRTIMTAGSLCCAVSSAIGSIFLMWDMPGSSWMPLVAVLAFAFGFGFGVGPIPWVLLGELLPTPIRVVGACICTLIYVAVQGIIGLSFPQLTNEVGLGGSLLFFAGFNGIMVVVVRLFLPETALSSLHLLEHVFSGGTYDTCNGDQRDQVPGPKMPLFK